MDHRRRSDVRPPSGAAGPDPPPAAPPGDFVDAAADGGEPEEPRTQLSRRELEVLRLLAEGRSDHQIAAALFISRRTATSHVGNILAKLGVDSRTAAAGRAIRERLV